MSQHIPRCDIKRCTHVAVYTTEPAHPQVRPLGFCLVHGSTIRSSPIVPIEDPPKENPS